MGSGAPISTGRWEQQRAVTCTTGTSPGAAKPDSSCLKDHCNCSRNTDKPQNCHCHRRCSNPPLVCEPVRVEPNLEGEKRSKGRGRLLPEIWFYHVLQMKGFEGFSKLIKELCNTPLHSPDSVGSKGGIFKEICRRTCCPR